MSFDDNILLKLRREFSGNEKYRLFLQQLDRLETELRAESSLVLKLRKESEELSLKNKELRVKNHDLEVSNGRLKTELGEYTATQVTKQFVSVKAYNKLQKSHNEWEARYWSIHKELQSLRNSPQSGDESL